MNETSGIVVYTDGGARGNPGPAAAGVFIPALGITFGHYMGEATNNEAEYTGIIVALQRLLKELGDRATTSTISMRADSQLVVRQMNGEYKIKEPRLQALAEQVKQLTKSFASVSFEYIPRSQNAIADSALNAVLDEHGK